MTSTITFATLGDQPQARGDLVPTTLSIVIGAAVHSSK